MSWNEMPSQNKHINGQLLVIVVVLTVLKQNAVSEQQCCQFIIASWIHCSVERTIWCRWIKKSYASISNWVLLLLSCKEGKIWVFLSCDLKQIMMTWSQSKCFEIIESPLCSVTATTMIIFYALLLLLHCHIMEIHSCSILDFSHFACLSGTKLLYAKVVFYGTFLHTCH